MNKLKLSDILLVFVLNLFMLGSLGAQTIVDKSIGVCSTGCTKIGEVEKKKHSYNWILNGSAFEGSSSMIEVCDFEPEDYYTLRVINKKGICTEMIRYKLHGIEKPVEVAPIDPCILSGKPATISLIGAYKSYKWSTGQDTPSIKVKNDRIITVEVVDENDCLISKRVNVKKIANNGIKNTLLMEGFQEVPIKIKRVKPKEKNEKID